MISGEYDTVFDAAPGAICQKRIILFHRPVGRLGRIKNITGNDHTFHLLFPDHVQQKCEDFIKFLIPPCRAESSAEMPVGCMQDLHNVSGSPPRIR